jgi:hypothetical protein
MVLLGGISVGGISRSTSHVGTFSARRFRKHSQAKRKPLVNEKTATGTVTMATDFEL